MEWIPSMYSTKDKAKVIAAFIVLILSVVFESKVESGSDELVTAIAVLVTYILGLYSDTASRGDKKQDE